MDGSWAEAIKWALFGLVVLVILTVMALWLAAWAAGWKWLDWSSPPAVLTVGGLFGWLVWLVIGVRVAWVSFFSH